MDFDIKQLQNLFINYKRDPEDYFINFIEIESSLKLSKNYYESLEIYQKHFRKILGSDIDLSKYLYLEQIDSCNITIFEYENLKSLGDGQYFGDYALHNSNNLRTATVECIEDCDFGFIFQETYKINFYEEMKKMWESDLSFFVDNFFFVIKKNVFREEYYHYFQCCHVVKKRYIYTEKSPVEDICFLKEGELEVSITTNLADLNKLIYVLCSVVGIKSEMYQMKTCNNT